MAQRTRALSYMVLGMVALSACSDSVLFDDKTKIGVPPPGGPVPGGPGGPMQGAPNNGGPNDFGPNAGDGSYGNDGNGGYGPGNGGGFGNGNGGGYGNNGGFVNGGTYNGNNGGGYNNGGSNGYNGPVNGGGYNKGGYNGAPNNGGYNNGGRGGSVNNGGNFGGIQAPVGVQAPVGGGLYSRNMTLELDPNADLREEDIFEILFKGQTVDPYKVQRLGGRIQLKAMVRQERVEAAGRDSDGRAFVRMRLYFVMNLDKESTLTRDFANGPEVVLSRVRGDKGRWQDRMEGRLKAADGRGDELEIRATRDAVNNRDLELSRPWSGEIFVVRNGKSLRLGRFNGILQELKE